MTSLFEDAKSELRLAGQARGESQQAYHLAQAQVLATLALAEQQQASNLIGYSTTVMPQWAGLAGVNLAAILDHQVGPRLVASLDLHPEAD